MFNVGRTTQWAFADGLGVNPKADPETIGFRNFDLYTSVNFLNLSEYGIIIYSIFRRDLGY